MILRAKSAHSGLVSLCTESAYQSKEELVEQYCPNNTHKGDEEGYDASNDDNHGAREVARPREEVKVGAGVHEVAATSNQGKTDRLCVYMCVCVLNLRKI